VSHPRLNEREHERGYRNGVDHLADLDRFARGHFARSQRFRDDSPLNKKPCFTSKFFPLRWGVRNVPTCFLIPVRDGNAAEEPVGSLFPHRQGEKGQRRPLGPLSAP
jgi:hypothetical protein